MVTGKFLLPIGEIDTFGRWNRLLWNFIQNLETLVGRNIILSVQGLIHDFHLCFSDNFYSAKMKSWNVGSYWDLVAPWQHVCLSLLWPWFDSHYCHAHPPCHACLPATHAAPAMQPPPCVPLAMHAFLCHTVWVAWWGASMAGGGGLVWQGACMWCVFHPSQPMPGGFPLGFSSTLRRARNCLIGTIS